MAASGGVGPCFGEPPLPALPLQGGDDELFSPSGVGDHHQLHHNHNHNMQHNHQQQLSPLSPTCCGADVSPTFDKPYMREMEKTIEGSRFCAQHVKNKDKFEKVRETKWIENPTPPHPPFKCDGVFSLLEIKES